MHCVYSFRVFVFSCVCVWTGRLDGTPEGQVAIIARMNITLFEEMVKTVRSGRSLRLGFAGVSQHYVWYARGRYN